MTASDTPNIRRLRRPMHNAPGAGRRLKVDWTAELKVGATRIPCTVLDISSAGAQLRTDATLPVNRKLWLMLPNAAAIPAALAWRQEGRVGVRFLREQNWLDGQEARRFDAASWIHSADR
jgi:hypothetical protein